MIILFSVKKLKLLILYFLNISIFFLLWLILLLSITNKLVITRVDCNVEGDVFYPDINLKEWDEISSENFTKNSENEYDFAVVTYKRIT